jgi:hypothetical protein
VEPAIPGSLSHLKLSRSALHTPFLRGSALCLRSVPPSPGLPPGTGFLRPETGAPNVPKRRDLCAETQEPPSPIAKNRPKMGLSAGRSSTASFGGLDGGRTRARTWDPLIKRHAAGIDISREFSQPDQNPIVTDQSLTAKKPTARAYRRIRSVAIPTITEALFSYRRAA